MTPITLGFSIADGSYPSLAASPGSLCLAFRTSGGVDTAIAFSDVSAYAWQEGEVPLAPGEPSDGACELMRSPLLAAHPAGACMHGGHRPRHLRLRLHPWGTLDVICGHYAANVGADAAATPSDDAAPARAGRA